MDKNFYAIGYEPPKQTFGVPFKYDGVHDSDYWAEQHPKANIKTEYWEGIRDAFVHQNRLIADRVREAPITDIANFLVGASKNERIKQSMFANNAWQSIKTISESSGVVYGFDTETIGDAKREGVFRDGQRQFYTVDGKLQAYDGYAGITEVGFSTKTFENGMADSAQKTTIAIGLNSKQIGAANRALELLESNGPSALDDSQVYMLKWFSQYGNGNHTKYFRETIVDFLGNQKFTTINIGALGERDIHDTKAIKQGIKNWEAISGFASSQKKHVLEATHERLQTMLNSDAPIVTANVEYDATVLAHELRDIGIDDFNPRSLYDKAADIVYANDAIAESQGVSTYKMQTRTGNKIKTVNAPASQQASQEAAGKEGLEIHVAGEDAYDAIDVATNKRFVENTPYYDEVLSANQTNIANRDPRFGSYSDRYFVFTKGSLNKNALDHAIVDGKETQTYSYRGQYLSLDLENSGYVEFTPLTEEGITAEPQTVYMLSMVDEDGNVIRKQYRSEAEAFNSLDNDTYSMTKAYGATKKRERQRKFQKELSDIDLARREYERLTSTADIRISSKKDDVNGFADMKRYLETIKNIKDVDELSDEDLAKIGVKSDTQKRTFRKLYARLKSEEASLNEVVTYINTNMSEANNVQKTIALNQIMENYRKELESIGYVKKDRTESIGTLDDALGIDIVVGDKQYRINGSNTETILYGLNRAYKGASREEIETSARELVDRRVLSHEGYARVSVALDSNVPRDSFYNTVYKDFAIALAEVTEPVVKAESGPLTFLENLEKREDLTQEQKDRILNKVLRSTRDETLSHADSIYQKASGKGKAKTMSEITQEREVMKTGRMKEKAEAIIQNISNSEYLKATDYKKRNEILSKIGDELGYTDKQKEQLVKMFYSTDGKGAITQYSIDSRKGIQTYIIPPTEDSSAFLLLTNKDHSLQVNELLSKGVEARTRFELDEIFEDHAAVIELRRINRVGFGTLEEMGLPAELKEVLGSDNVYLTTTKQGKSTERFLLPSFNGFKFSNADIYHMTLAQPGDTLIEDFRLVDKSVLDYVEAGEFHKATRAKYKKDNELLSQMSSSSSGRAYEDKTEKLVRAINYNKSDKLNAFKFDVSGLRDVIQFEAQMAIKNDDIANPIYQMIRAIGVKSDDLKPNELLNEDNLKKVMESKSWDEFLKKNLFMGKVSEDATFAEMITQLPTPGQDMAAFDKHIYGMILETAQSDKYSKYFTEDAIKSLRTFTKAVPHLRLVTSKTDTKKLYVTWVGQGDVRDLGATDTSMRPTYGQVGNSLMFDDSKIVGDLPKGTSIGPVSKTLIEDVMDRNIDIQAPSGIPYNSQTDVITTTFKQMSDMELQLTYRKLEQELESIAQTSGLEYDKLRHAFDIFTAEHISLNEGKMFGAPMLHNQEPFRSTDIKKISMPQFTTLEGSAKAATIARLNEYLEEGNILHFGDVIGSSGETDILWKGPDTQLTKDNINELFEFGETTIVPHQRMVQDTKWMIEQEKATVHFMLIDDVFMKENPIFRDKGEALRYFQTIFDKVSGYDGVSDYQAAFIGNVESLKASHSTAISIQSKYRTIVNEYKKAGKLEMLSNALNNMEEFQGWNFRVTDTKYGKVLVSNQRDKKGVINAIMKLKDVIESNQYKEYGLDESVNRKIIDIFATMKEANTVVVEGRRSNANEIMGTSVLLDERMKQSIRLRAMKDDFVYYTDEGAVDGILDGVNGRIIEKKDKNGNVIERKGRTWNDLYLDELQSDIEKGVYDEMNTSAFKKYEGIESMLKEISSANQAEFKAHRRAIKEQKKVVGGIIESVNFYNGKFDVNARDVIRVQMDDILKRLPEHFNSEDLQELIFKVDGKPSKFLEEAADGMVKNKSSVYLDFGTTIGGRKGMLIPLLNVNTTVTTVGEDIEKQVFFNRIQGDIVHFLNTYKDTVGQKDGTIKIAKAIDGLYSSFADELSIFDKNSLVYKTFGKTLLPNSGQSLAQDEIAPIVEAMMQDDFIAKSIEEEKRLRIKASEGDVKAASDLDKLLAERSKKLDEIATRIESGDLDENLYKLAGLETLGQSGKGYRTITDSAGKIIKREFTNTFDTSRENLRYYGLREDIIGWQLYNEYLSKGKIESFETNDAFNQYIEKAHTRIVEKLKAADIAVHEDDIMAGLDQYMISIKTLNEDTIKNANTRNIKNREAFEKIGKILGDELAVEYLATVGIQAGEVWRPPVIQNTQPLGRIYLNKDMHGREIRSNIPAMADLVKADHDGDQYMNALFLNGGGLKTKEEQEFLIKAYEDFLSQNKKIIANQVRKGKALKSDTIWDENLIQLQRLEMFDDERYMKAMQAWIDENHIGSSVKDLTEGQKILAAQSDIVKLAFKEFDAEVNMLTHQSHVRAAITSRVRQDNVGFVSTSNFKIKDTLVRIMNDTKYSDADRAKAANILKSVQGFLTEIEQTSIDVKHIYDAVTIAETPKWVKGVDTLFDVRSQTRAEKGLYQMLSAVNASTFKVSEKELKEIHADILSSSLEDLTKRSYKNDDEKLMLQLKQEFRALYEMRDLPDAIAIQNDILRKKNPSLKKLSEALEIERLTETDSVFGDIASQAFMRRYSDEALLIDYNNVYFRAGTIGEGHVIANSAYILEEATNKRVVLQRVNLDTLEVIDTKTFNGETFAQLNKQLQGFLDNTTGVNKYAYINSPGIKDKAFREMEAIKMGKTINNLIFNTKDNRNGFEMFESFIKFDGTQQMKFGINNYSLVNQLVMNKSVITNTRELLNDYVWAKKEGMIKSDVTAAQLLKSINEDIANHPERYKRDDGWIKGLDEILKEKLVSKDMLGSESVLDTIHERRVHLRDFKIDEFNDNIKLLNDESYDIINAEQRLTKAYAELEQLNQSLVDSGAEIPEELANVLSTKDADISSALSDIQSHNQQVVKKVQDNVYALFKDTQQMDTKFNWGAPRQKSVVGFGEYMGKSFSDLSQVDIDRILQTDISDEALKSMGSMEAYATKKSVELLQQYKASNPVTKKVSALSGRGVDVKINDTVKKLGSIHANLGGTSNTTEQAGKTATKMKRNTLSGEFGAKAKEVFNNLPKKTIAIAAGSLAAIGVVNNLLHNQKNKSPLTPTRRQGSPDSPSMTSPAGTQAPVSRNRTVYHDNGSGFNFKVTAKTQNLITAQNNARLIGMAGGGTASSYSQADMSGVTDNWLENKFAELV